METINIVQLITSKGSYDVIDSLKVVKNKVEKGGLQKFNRGEVETKYKGQDCKDKQTIILDLSLVEVYGYTLHEINLQ